MSLPSLTTASANIDIKGSARFAHGESARDLYEPCVELIVRVVDLL